MIKIKSSVEYSDTGYEYASSEQEILHLSRNEQLVRLYGDDVVSLIYKQPLEKVVGTYLLVNGTWFVANYLYSSITSRDGRAYAYNLIEERNIPTRFMHTPIMLNDNTLLSKKTVAFDIETGGKSGIRCISFFDGSHSYYVDCRDIKSNKNKVIMLQNLFSDLTIKWIAHNGVHDITEICKRIKVPRFQLYKDTIWFHRKVEFRSLRYLAGVYLGSEVYKHELEEANIEEDFNKLVNYCCKDSYFTFVLSNRLPLRDMSLLNQVVSTMMNPPDLHLVDTIYTKYPQFEGMTKKELKDQYRNINPKDLQLLKQTINPPSANITIHGLTGLTVTVPQSLTTDAQLWMLSYKDNVRDIMAYDKRFDSPQLSAYRFAQHIEPIMHWGHYEVLPQDVFLVNDVCCLVTKEYPNSIPVKFDEVKQLFS